MNLFFVELLPPNHLGILIVLTGAGMTLQRAWDRSSLWILVDDLSRSVLVSVIRVFLHDLIHCYQCLPTSYKPCGLQPCMTRKESITPQLCPEQVSYLKNELDRFKARASERRSTKSPKQSLTAPKASETLGIACVLHLKENILIVIF
jgi:hypothetical protein